MSDGNRDMNGLRRRRKIGKEIMKRKNLNCWRNSKHTKMNTTKASIWVAKVKPTKL